MKELLNQFIQYLHTERGLSARTRSAYQRDLSQAIDFLEEHGVSGVASVSEHDIRSFVAHRHRQGLGGKSLQRVLSSIRSFYKWLSREGKVESNPALSVRAPKSTRHLPGTLDVDTVNRLLDIRDDSPLAVRDKAIMELFYSSGLRLSELADLQWHQLDLGSGLVTITGKGNRTRMVPVGRKARDALVHWRKTRGQLADPSETRVFVSRRGQAIAPRSIQARIRYWANRQGLPQNVHPHLLRHSFASHILESSGDLRAVQELLGHADISTTQIYTHLDFQHLAKVYDKAHPRAGKKSS